MYLNPTSFLLSTHEETARVSGKTGLTHQIFVELLLCSRYYTNPGNTQVNRKDMFYAFRVLGKLEGKLDKAQNYTDV